MTEFKCRSKKKLIISKLSPVHVLKEGPSGILAKMRCRYHSCVNVLFCLLFFNVFRSVVIKNIGL